MNSIQLFNTNPFIDALKAFFKELNVPIDYLADEPASPADVLGERFKAANEAHQLIEDVYALGMVNDAIFEGTETFKNLSEVKKLKADYDGLLIFGVTLKSRKDGLPITRSHLAEITRAFNRSFPYTPVTIIFKYGNLISFANSERIKYKQEWREGEKVGKVSLLKDIDIKQPHRGHISILTELSIPNTVTSFSLLYKHWQTILDVSILNKKFFQDLSNWYFAAMSEVSFPDDLERKKEVRNATNLIRLITRVIFIWFIKEKKLVPASLFRKDFVTSILKDFNKNKKSQNYYNAILQNLFFGTLNQKMNERDFISEKSYKGINPHYNVTTLYRYADLFTISKDEIKKLFRDVPFLNGGLFDCLDKPNENDETKVDRVDGFSSKPEKRAIIPDYLFFGEEKEVDLNDVYGTKNKHYSSRGLINLLESYKFTVAENTPMEEEIALDPELLGKVLENLLASYNPETQTTARKQTGSFYTPREIVNYMVDESLLEYIKQSVKNDSKDFESRLRDVFTYSENPNPFSEAETKDLIEAINNCKILDPACGSGAFPMGILHKMVHILQKLDPENKLWKDLQRKKAIEETEAAFKIGDKDERAKRLAEINDVFENNASDYGRKLYLIENCIYGIDIQPIAVQIAKLRFFISLVIDQKVNKTKENFGIRSLPNLETKFVAANTLIGLDKPQQTLLRNPAIEVKENELKELRHKYFTANTRKEKIALQKQDKKLRLEIAKMLENDGWETKVAKQIVAFDPYDQNQSSGWFDSEWMFGLTNGFDIIIGNPPYVNIEKIAKSDREYFLSKYGENGSLGKRYDLYQIFILQSIRLFGTKSILSFILPNTFLVGHSYLTLRKQMAKKTSIFQVVDLPQNVFETATVDNVLLFLKTPKEKSGIVSVRKLQVKASINRISNSDWDDSFSIEQSSLTDESQYRINVHSNPIKQELYQKLFIESEVLGNITESSQGIIIYKTEEDSEENLYTSFDYKKGWKKLLRGTNIGYYEIKWAGEYINYGNWLWSQREEKFFKEPKILLQALRNKSLQRRLVGVYDDEKYYNAHNLANIISKRNSGYDLKYILGIFNSQLINTWYKDHFPNVNINPSDFREIPIKKAASKKQESLIKLVEKILLIKKENPETDTSKLERQIDDLVYKLYDLTEGEIKIIEGNE